MVLVAAGMGWLAVDFGARNDVMSAIYRTKVAVLEEIDARFMMRELREGLEQQDPEQMTLLAFYHSSGRTIYPEALHDAMAREFGPQDHQMGIELLKRIADQGYGPGEWYYWNEVGWPDREVLLRKLASGSQAAAMRLLSDLGSAGCDSSEDDFRSLEEAAAGIHSEPAPENGWYISGASVRADIESIRTWKAESCEKPAA